MNSAAPHLPTSTLPSPHHLSLPASLGLPAAKVSAAQRILDSLHLVKASVPVQHRLVHTGDRIYEAGQPFKYLYVLNSGIFKTLNTSQDGREQVVGLHFKGDWLGFDGIASGHYGNDAVAMDTADVWCIHYEALCQAAMRNVPLMNLLHQAMSREISRDRNSLLSLCTLSADARVADFLRYWVDSLASRGLRTDQITLRMTRAEIGNYLGMTLETVSRALTRLAARQLIGFTAKGRRDILIPDVAQLVAFIESSQPAPRSATLQ
ncbi:Crp/Fnr family transcriptional regulator [Aquabacterium sp.]|uniref:Crp/Fnr family transcriptional regulator n=1 Tax=Aquabacterium sp. TaxID=1872578 RepID=UPI003D6C994B